MSLVMKRLVAFSEGKLFKLLTFIEKTLSSAPAPAPAPHSSEETSTSQPSSSYDLEGLINVQNQAAEWQKMILGYCFATSIALLALYFQIQPHDDVPLSFYLLSLTLLVSFSASLLAQALSAQALRMRFPIIAGISEQVGFGFAVLTFFMAIEIILPWTIKWVAWVICSLTLFLSFVLYNHSHSNN